MCVHTCVYIYIYVYPTLGDKNKKKKNQYPCECLPQLCQVVSYMDVVLQLLVARLRKLSNDYICIYIYKAISLHSGAITFHSGVMGPVTLELLPLQRQKGRAMAEKRLAPHIGI